MKHIVIDIETYGNGKDGVYKAVKDCQEFTTGEILKDTGVSEVFTDPNKMAKRIIELIEAERKRHGRLYVWGWNTQYDFNGIFRDYLKESLIITLDNEKMIKYFSFYPFLAMYGKQGDKRFKAEAYFLDVMSFFRMPLEEFGRILGKEKSKMPMETKSLEEIQKYCHRDCEITLEAVKKVKKIINEIGFRPKRYLTAGNVAMTCFLTWARKNGVQEVFSNKGKTYVGERINSFRSAFRGGRFECHRTGKFKGCIKIDINAMYPYIMQNMEFPDLKVEHYSQDKEELLKAIDNKIGVIKCRLKSPKDIRYGYIPIRFKDMTYYPKDKVLDGMWTTLEIKRALELRYEIIDLIDGVYFDKANINPFKEYISILWTERKKRTGVDKEVVKLLMNSLYGKWSQYKTEDDIRQVERKDIRQWLDKGYKFMMTAGAKYIIYRKGRAKLPRYANPMISMWITALARDYIYRFIDKVEPNDLIYIATDGIIMKERDLDIMNIGDDIGQFKIEGRGDCFMLGENRYKFGDEIKIGGIPKKDINEDVLKGKRIVHTSRMITIKEAMKNNALKDQVGKFVDEDVKINQSRKTTVELPDIIIEEDKYKEVWDNG